MRHPAVPDSVLSQIASADVLGTGGTSDDGYSTDLAEFVASIAAQTDDGLFPDFSDLALEIVLSEVVARACLATGATGAGVFMPRNGEVICRASSGSTAPERGDRLDVSFKPYADCVRTRRTQRCDDLLAHPQADLGALLRMDVRSVILMPLFQGVELVGVLELLSSKPSAFGEREEEALQELGGGTMSKLQQTTENLEAQREAGLTLEPEVEGPKTADPQVLRYVPSITSALAAFVLVCLLLFGALVARHFGTQKTTVHTNPLPAPPVAAAQAPLAVVYSGEQEQFDPAVKVAPLAKPSAGKAVPPGGLAVFENGIEVFRLPPANSQDKSPVADQKTESPAKQ